MPRKITKKKFIQAIENNEEGLTNLELAAKLGITFQYFYILRKKYKAELKNVAKQIIVSNATNLVRDLLRQSREGRTEATKVGLELADIYIPKQAIALNASTSIEEKKAKYKKYFQQARHDETT